MKQFFVDVNEICLLYTLICVFCLTPWALIDEPSLDMKRTHFALIRCVVNNPGSDLLVSNANAYIICVATISKYVLQPYNVFIYMLPTLVYVLSQTLATASMATHTKCIGIDPNNIYLDFYQRIYALLKGCSCCSVCARCWQPS